MERASPSATKCPLKLGDPRHPQLQHHWPHCSAAARHFQSPLQKLLVLPPSQMGGGGGSAAPPVSSLPEIPPHSRLPCFRFPSCLAAPPLAGLDLPSASLSLILLVFPSRLASHTTLKVSSWMVLWLSSWKKPQKLISLSLATKAFFHLSTPK